MVHYGKGQNQIKQNKFVCTKTKAFTASFNRERISKYLQNNKHRLQNNIIC